MNGKETALTRLMLSTCHTFHPYKVSVGCAPLPPFQTRELRQGNYFANITHLVIERTLPGF